MGDILSYYQDRVANESFLGTAQERRSVIQHLRLIGYTLSTAAPASATLTLSVPATATDLITIRRGDAFATKGQRDKPSVRFEYTREQPLTIDCARALPIDPADQQKGLCRHSGRGRAAHQRGDARDVTGNAQPAVHAGPRRD